MQTLPRSLTHELPPEIGPAAVELFDRLETETRLYVAEPLFGAKTVEGFEERLSDALAHGAAVRQAFVQDVWVLPEPDRSTVLGALVHPPVEIERVLRELSQELLGGDEFLLVRALQLAQDVRDLQPRLLAMVSTARPPANFGALAAAAGAHEALYMAWVLLMLEQVPMPVPEVARAAAAEFLRLGQERRAALKRVLQPDPDEAPPDIVIDGVSVDAYLAAHPGLVLAVGALIGIASSDPAVQRVTVRVVVDPEADDRWLAITALVPGEDCDRLDDLLTARALQAGVLAPSDRTGGLVLLTVRPT